MLPAILYFLKVICCSGLLLGYYWFFLRNKTFHQYNRFFLLGILAISLVAPAARINIGHKTETGKSNMIKMLQVVNSPDEYMDEIIIRSGERKLNTDTIFFTAYGLACLSGMLMFLFSVLSIINLLRKNPAKRYDNYVMITTQAKGTPFSFLKFIFWNNEIDMYSKPGKQILAHEVAHIEHGHSYDKLLVNFLIIFFWFNPFFWLLRKELNMIHEFIADQEAIDEGASEDFAAMILCARFPKQAFALTNPFCYSPIKRRIMMLTHLNKKKVFYFSRMLGIPVLILVLAAFTLKTGKINYDITTTNPKHITVVIDAGHGGNDMGAYGLNDVKEKDITLKYAQKIKELNTDENIEIFLSRDKDIFMNPSERATFINKLSPDLMISIHMSALPVGLDDRSGMEVYVSKNDYSNSLASKTFASALIGRFNGNYGLDVAPNPIQRTMGIKVLQESKCPAILIEAGYITTPKDAAYLSSTKGIEDFSRNVLNAINDYRNRSGITTSLDEKLKDRGIVSQRRAADN